MVEVLPEGWPSHTNVFDFGSSAKVLEELRRQCGQQMTDQCQTKEGACPHGDIFVTK